IMCATGARRFARRAKPTANYHRKARLDPVLPECEPRLQHGGHMTLQLPERANLEQLKKQAKSLLAAARTLDPETVHRFEAVFAGRSITPDSVALHDAQFVLAREYGFKSWNDMKEEVEVRSLSFTAALDDFIRCATGDAKDRAFRLLAKYKDIAHANLYTE